MLGCAVLINLAGIMFTSERFSTSEFYSDQRDGVTYAVLCVIFFSVAYFFTVLFCEVFASCLPKSITQALMSRLGGAQDLKGASTAVSEDEAAAKVKSSMLSEAEGGGVKFTVNPLHRASMAVQREEADWVPGQPLPETRLDDVSYALLRQVSMHSARGEPRTDFMDGA